MVAYYQCLHQTLMRYLTLERDHCILFGFHVMGEILSFLESSQMVRSGVTKSNKAK